MSYAIFRVEPINKLKDLGQIGAHNTRTKEAYRSNPDIDVSKSHNNIQLVPITHKDYYSSYMNLVKEYKKQHDEKQKTERENRKKSFNQMLPLEWTAWISLQSKGLSRVFSNTTLQKHQFFGTQPSSQSNSHIHT